MGDLAPIVKNVIHSGQNYKPITDGSKVHFHFQTWKCGKERVLIDDSRKIGQKEPMILVIGHKFKLEVWESIVKMMAVGEVASFTVKKELVFSYPFVSKTLRELGQDASKRKHACTMTLHTEGLGYSDLDSLMKEPCDLEFIIELLKVDTSEEYEKEVWQLSSQERLELVPSLREKGNLLYGQKKYDEAEEVYAKAIAICEQLMIRERKCDEEWVNLNKIKLPILLNYAQCKLIKDDYYAVIEHCNTVLEHDKGTRQCYLPIDCLLIIGYDKTLASLTSRAPLFKTRVTGNVCSRPKLIIDQDGGADDAMAIFMALLYEQYFNGPNVIALTTAHGNVDEDQTFINSQRILDVAERRDVPIYRGSNFSLVSSVKSDHFFGVDGLGDNEYEPVQAIEAQTQHAAVGIIELAMKYPGEITLVALGALTNVALAVQLDPTLIGRLAHLYVGGGNVYSDLEPNAEFNAAQDVESYHAVIQNANPEKVTIVPYSQVKTKSVSRQWRKEVLGAIPTKIMKSQNTFERISVNKYDYWALLDPVAMGTVLNDEMIGNVKYSQNSIILCDNEKALYRRAKAHIGAWNPDLAEEDLLRLRTLNPTLGPTVDKELAHIRKLQKEKQSKDKDSLKKMFGTENGT